MENLLVQIPSWIVTAIIGLLSVAVGWGWIRAEVNHLREDQKLNKQKIDELQKDKLNVAFKVDCGDFREKCRDDVNSKFNDIKLAIDKNRETVLSQFDEMREFMGYMKRAVEDINGKR
jgi:uncharacterized membrane-anchored protein YhcB (DUF1043 family)